MSANLLNKLAAVSAQPSRRLRWLLIVGLPVWTVGGFFLAQALVMGILYALQFFGVSFSHVNQTILLSVAGAVVYLVTIAIIIGVPWLLKISRTTKKDIGLTRPMSWSDIGFAPLGFIVYLLIAALLVYVVGALLPGIDLKQTQETGYDNVTKYYQYILVLVSLVVIAPIAEEIIFRGYLYGKLRKIVPIWIAMPLVSVIFGLVHGQWNVAIDVFCLSLILCTLREITGNIWAGILLHMLKNGIAFYVLFISPLVLHTIVG